jgi:hypothetical protein
MSTRFLSGAIVLVAGAFLVAASLGFSPTVVGWLALGIGCVVGVTVLGAFAFPGRGLPQRVIDVALLVGGAWTIVASRAFSGTTEKWLSFSEAVLFFGLGLVGLVLHETLSGMSRQHTVPISGDGRGARPVERGPVGLAR